MKKQMIQWSLRSMVILLAVTSLAACSRGGSSGNRSGKSSRDSIEKRRLLEKEQRGGTSNTPERVGPVAGQQQPQSAKPSAPAAAASAAAPAPAPAPAQVQAAPGKATPVPFQSQMSVRASGGSNSAIGETSTTSTTGAASATASSATSSGPISEKDMVHLTPISGSGASSSSTGAISASQYGLPGGAAAGAASNGVISEADIRGTIQARQATGEVLYVGDQGPGVPRGHETTSPDPKITGVIDEQGRAFTTTKDDAIMAAIINKMNQMDPQVRADSEAMAQSVSHVEFDNNYGVLNLDIDFKLEDGDIKLAFSGQLQGQGGQLAVRRNNSNYEFKAQAICVDVRRECRNAVIIVEHFLNGQPCRRIYIDYRNMMARTYGDTSNTGDGHFTLSNDDYRNWSSKTNIAQKSFLRLLANTAQYTKMLYGEEAPSRLPPMPRLEYIGVRSWAVAYGKSFSEVIVSKMRIGAGVGYTFSVYGPMTISRLAGEDVQEWNIREKNTGLGTDQGGPEVSKQFNERFNGGSISQILLVDNDGRGNFVFEFQFYGNLNEKGVQDESTGASTRVTFTGLTVPSFDRQQLDQVIP